MPAFRFDNSYARLPAGFFAPATPAGGAAPHLIALNQPLADELGLDLGGLDETALAALFSGAQPPEGAEPIAAAYAGHQFGQFVPALGDGRAVLLGEVIDVNGHRRDIQLKGAGRTLWSRGGDGNAALGPVLREYIVSEAMAALGVPTTRALAAALTGASVRRETLQPGAVLTRIAASHIRVGTFQYFAARGDTASLQTLLDHVIARHDPEAANAPNPAAAMLETITRRQASLIARWLLIGFVHGVMNTDNMAISGETIDYGPCAFLDHYEPGKVFSSIDRNGRYAYASQPAVAQWNLARLAECLVPLIDVNEDAAITKAQDALNAFAPTFNAAYTQGLCAKVGLPAAADEDLVLARDLLQAMAENEADMTLTFRRLGDAVADPGQDEPVRSLFIDPTRFDAWAVRWRDALARAPEPSQSRRDAMNRVNPALIPRNHRIAEVIAAAVDHGDFAPFRRLTEALATPYAERAADDALTTPPLPDEEVTRTFCGT